MDEPQIAELKELIRQNTAIAQDTNKILRHMRSGARLKSLFGLIVLAVSIGVSVWSYYAFVAPRVEQIKNVYQTTIAPLQGTSGAINNFLKSFNKATTTTAQ